MPVVTQVIRGQASRDSRQSDPRIWLFSMRYPTSLLYLLGNYAKLSVFPGKSHGQRSLVGYMSCSSIRLRRDIATTQQQHSPRTVRTYEYL